MTLKEAIKHCEDVADYDCFTDEQRKCSEEHRQLADWLRELKERREKAQLSGEDATFDCISRQDAIDVVRRATVDTNPSHFEAHQKFMQFMDDAEISSFGRWEWSNGFNTALTAINVDLRRLPSASTDLSIFSDKLWKIAYERGKAEGRKKGKWIEKDDCWDGVYYECSVCKDAFTLMDGTPSDNNYNFCPNCGSYNGGEEE